MNIAKTFFAVFCFATSLPAAEFYVAPNGRDTNPGTEASPFLTLTRARDAVRVINSTMTKGIHVYLRGGEYPITSTVQFSTQDSGFNGHKVRYCAYRGETPILTGGKTVSNWHVHDKSKNIYRASVGTNLFRQLYLNQTTQGIRARTPNRVSVDLSGYWTSVVPEKNKIQTSKANWTASCANVPAGKLREVEVVMAHHWYHQRIGIGKVVDLGTVMEITPADTTGKFHKKKISFYQNSPANLLNPTFFENALVFLDADLEWYHDPATGILYLKLPAGTTPGSYRVEIPSTQTLISIIGTGAKPVSNIEFHGLTFQCTNWTAPSRQGTNMTQAAQAISPLEPVPGMIVATHALRLAFRHGIIRNSGGQGLLFYNVDHSEIESNEFYNIAATGIAIDLLSGKRPTPTNQSEKTSIWNNHARKCGNHYSNGDFLLASNVKGLIVDHNLIYDMPYSGMQIGEQPGSSTASDCGCTQNQIRYNHIHHCTQVHPDGGGIYTLGGLQTHSVIAENYIHDVKLPPWHNIKSYLVDHIYLDNATQGIEVRNNVVSGGRAAERNGSFANFMRKNSQSNTAIQNNAGIRPGYKPQRSGHIHTGTARTVLADPLPWIEVYGKDLEITNLSANCPCGWHTPKPSQSNGTDFGIVPKDSWVERTFRITNSGIAGGAPLMLTSNYGSAVELTGDPQFQLVADVSSRTIPSGGSMTFKVKFNPTAKAIYRATVRIPNNDSHSGPFEFALTGDSTRTPIPTLITANFTDANGSTSVHQYPGMAGNGWSSAWLLQNDTFQSISVTDNTPLTSGSGNYLSTTRSNTTGSLSAVGRRFSTDSGSGGIDLTKSVRFSFDLRIDGLAGWNSTSDLILLNANNSTTITSFGTSAFSSWIIGTFGAINGGATAGQWAFYNGKADGGTSNPALFVPSGMPLSVGKTYTFTILSDPTTKKYIATISDGTKTVTSKPMGWRSKGASTGVGFASGVSATSGDAVSWSLDNVVIQNPTTPSGTGE